jgi:hypothetical protein
MSMGFVSGYADVIKKEFIAQLLPGTWSILAAMVAEDLETFQEFTFGKEDPELDYLAAMYQWPDNFEGDFDDDRIEAYQNTLQQLFTEFSEATKQGESVLALGLGYHNCDDDGSKYDDINGGYFCIGNVWQLTPAAAALPEGTFERQTFVTMC